MSDQFIQDPFKIRVEYRYSFEGGKSAHFIVDENVASEKNTCYSQSRPSWAKLGFNQCSNCPLSEHEQEYCPATLAIMDIIEFFSSETSYTKCRCEVNLGDKTILVSRPIQDALYPLIGLRMATSSCPHFYRLRPMARFHDPFANPFETVCRSISFYLMTQFFNNKGKSPWESDLSGLKKFYKNINKVNSAMVSRLNGAGVMDAAPNCIVILSVFGSSVHYFFEDFMKAFEQLFKIGGAYDD